MVEYTELQPKDGETVMHCGHADSTAFVFFKGNFRFLRVDPVTTEVVTGEAQGLICCEECLNIAGQDPMKVVVRDHATWVGNKPIIKKDRSH